MSVMDAENVTYCHTRIICKLLKVIGQSGDTAGNRGGHSGDTIPITVDVPGNRGGQSGDTIPITVDVPAGGV